MPGRAVASEDLPGRANARQGKYQTDRCQAGQMPGRADARQSRCQAGKITGMADARLGRLKAGYQQVNSNQYKYQVKQM